ncbi:MAG TPA: hypothetical protein VFU15_08105 [Bacteroidia bacterium]|nr:hypothetical protein [Bacteroidia bacterium]
MKYASPFPAIRNFFAYCLFSWMLLVVAVYPFLDLVHATAKCTSLPLMLSRDANRNFTRQEPAEALQKQVGATVDVSVITGRGVLRNDFPPLFGDAQRLEWLRTAARGFYSLYIAALVFLALGKFSRASVAFAAFSSGVFLLSYVLLDLQAVYFGAATRHFSQYNLEIGFGWETWFSVITIVNTILAVANVALLLFRPGTKRSGD